MHYPKYEVSSDPQRFDQGIGSFLDFVHLPDRRVWGDEMRATYDSSGLRAGARDALLNGSNVAHT